MTQRDTNAPTLFPYLTQERLWLVGTFLRGGTVHILAKDSGSQEQPVPIKLGPMTFGVLAVLMTKAIRAGSSSEASGFATPLELKAEIEACRDREREQTHYRSWRDDQGPSLENNAAKHVFKLRAALARWRGGKAWADRIIETSVHGYRVSTDPAHLHLEVRGMPVLRGDASRAAGGPTPQ
jgi:hypothetical protein